MKYFFNIIVFGGLYWGSCSNPKSAPQDTLYPQKPPDTLALLHKTGQMGWEEKKVIENGDFSTFWGHRFIVFGDFDGNGAQERLTEKLISRKDHEEIGKFCGEKGDSMPDCYWTASVNRFRQPCCILDCSDPKISDFEVTIDTLNTIGLIYCHNVGDLNRDGTDEIVLVEDKGGCNSTIRYAQIIGFKNKTWQTIQTFRTSADAFPWLDEAAIKEKNDPKNTVVIAYEKALRQVKGIVKVSNGAAFYLESDPEAPNGETWKKLKHF